jgi:arabinose-5-phosphate isomerase
LTVDYIERARRVFDIELEEIKRLRERLDDKFITAVRMMRESVDRRGKIVLVGVGKSGHIGEKIAATLTSTGSPAVVLNSLNALHGDLGMVADGDVVLALSYSGETEELLNVLPAFTRFNVKVISITGNPDSFLATNSDVHLNAMVEKEACPLNLAPTSSTTAMLVLGDALAMVLLEARGFRKEDFARYHPGGRLGRTLLLKAHQIMRGLDRVAVVKPEMKVREVLIAMAGKKAGSCTVVGADGRLIGLFTHGDFGRNFEIEPNLLELEVGKYMTRNPITITGETLAMEVLHILQNNRIDDIPVVNEDNVPVGIVDSQDLARHKLV